MNIEHGTYWVNWRGVIVGGSEAEEINAQFKGAAFLQFYKNFENYDSAAKGVTVEASENGDPLGFNDRDMNFLKHNGVILDTQQKSNYIHVYSIKYQGDPI